jgi:hypothetical protein
VPVTAFSCIHSIFSPNNITVFVAPLPHHIKKSKDTMGLNVKVIEVSEIGEVIIQTTSESSDNFLQVNRIE